MQEHSSARIPYNWHVGFGNLKLSAQAALSHTQRLIAAQQQACMEQCCIARFHLAHGSNVQRHTAHNDGPLERAISPRCQVFMKKEPSALPQPQRHPGAEHPQVMMAQWSPSGALSAPCCPGRAPDVDHIQPHQLTCCSWRQLGADVEKIPAVNICRCQRSKGHLEQASRPSSQTGVWGPPPAFASGALLHDVLAISLLQDCSQAGAWSHMGHRQS